MLNRKTAIIKYVICFFVAIFVFASDIYIKASENESFLTSIYTLGNAAEYKTRINITQINGENYFILPSASTPEYICLYAKDYESSKVKFKGVLKEDFFYNGIEINLNNYCEKENYLLTFSIYSDEKKVEEFDIRFIFSENIPAIYLLSNDSVTKGREWIESSIDKSNKTNGYMIMQKSTGQFLYNGDLSEIKGRGNSTWSEKKKPYQIKTEIAVDLLETGNNNDSKTWLLLANYFDPTLIRNSIALNLGKQLGMGFNIESTHIDLYYDGEYRGNYLLSEKVEIGNGRVEIDNLETFNEKVNQNINLKNLQVKSDKTKNGATYTYCAEMLSPENLTGGYLLEMDFQTRATEEICYFYTSRGQYIVVKSPEYASKEEMEYISSLYQEYEDAVYNGGINPHTGKSYDKYVDADSTAIYYLINEFGKARDAFSSSAYLYKTSDKEQLHMGPLWDYDLSFGKSRYGESLDEHPRGISIYNTDFSLKLLSIDDFKNRVHKIYTERMLPILKQMSEQDINSSYVRKSCEINSLLWYEGLSVETEFEKLYNFLRGRISSMNDVLSISTEEMFLADKLYNDVFPSNWFYDEVEDATKLGYVNGVGKGFFDPYANVKRAEIAQVLFNIAKAPEIELQYSFQDVKETDWYSKAVSWVVSTGIMSEDSSERFSPEKYSTREEVVLSIYLLKKPESKQTNLLKEFKDVSEISENAREAFEWAVNEKIIFGSNNKIRPKANLTRAEFAAILARVK